MMKWIHKLKKRSRSSIFSIILIVNLCSIVVLSVFNYYVFNRLNDKAYLKSFLSYNERVTELAFKNIDNQIMRTVLNIAQLHFSAIWENQPLLLAQEKDVSLDPDEVRAIAEEMGKIKKTYSCIRDINLYYQGTQTVVTGFDKVHFPAGEDRIRQYLPWYEAYQKKELPEGFCYNPDGLYLNKEPVVSYIKTISMPKWKGKDIVLAIFVDPKSFTEYIDQQEGELTILTRENHVLYDSEGIEAGQKRLEEAENGNNVANAKNAAMFELVSSNTGLTYRYYVETSKFYEDYYSASRMFLVSFLISIAFNLILLVLISYYNYVTYRKRILTVSKEAGIAIEQGDQSFDRSLNLLTTKITDLHEVVQSSRGLVFQNAVRSMVLDRKKEGIVKELDAYFNGEYVCVYLIGVPESELEQLNVEQLQEEYLPGQGSYDVLFTTIEKHNLVAVQIFEPVNQARYCQDFIRRLEQYWKECPITTGDVCKLEESGIYHSYTSAIDADRYRYILTQNNLIAYEEINRIGHKESGSHMKLFEAIRRDINNENLLEVKMHLEMLVESFKSGNYAIEYCMSTLRDLVTLFYQIMQQYQLDMWIVLGYDIREYYKEIPNIDAFHRWCDGISEQILKNIHQKKMSVNTDIRTQLLALIQDNSEKNISLDYLAEQLNMRPDAASRIFRQTMGVGYTEYMKTRKLNRALELLEEGLSIKDIAETLGYSTSQYFIKVFKENYGVTPYQYKKSLPR